MIAIVALLGTARFSLALAGMDIGTSFGGIGAYIVKLELAGGLLALFETSIAKMRVFRVPEFLGAGLMLGLLAMLLLFVSRGR